MRLVHGRLIHWTQDLLLEAGVEGVGVYPRFQDERTSGDHVVVMPYRMSPWPKLVETDRPINLLARSTEPPSGVPRFWSSLGRLLRQGVDQCYEMGAAGGRMLPAVPLEGLPAPLARWYRDGGTTGPHLWRLDKDGGEYGRIPTLLWSRPLTIRTYYLILASDAASRSGDALDTFAVPALAVVTLGLQLRRSLSVSMPAVESGDDLEGFARAMAEACGGELGEQLMALVGELNTAQDHRVSVVPVPDLPSDDFANVMRSLDRPLQPAVHVAVQVAVGGGVQFGPGASPKLNQRMGRRSPPQ